MRYLLGIALLLCHFASFFTPIDSNIDVRGAGSWKRSDDAVPTVFDSSRTGQEYGPPPPPNVETGQGQSQSQAKIRPSGSRTSAYKDRKEHMRTLQDALDNFPRQDCENDDDQNPTIDSQDHSTQDQSVLTDPMFRLVRSQVVITSFSPADVRSVHCQAVPEMENKQCTIKPDQRIHSEQCTIVGHPFVNLPADWQLPPPTSPKTVPVASTSTPNSKKRRAADEIDMAMDDQDFDESFSHVDSEKKDPPWNPNFSYDDLDGSDTDDRDTEVVKFYVVAERKLLHLFKMCQKCGCRGAEANVTSMNGTLVNISQHCLLCDELTKWSSQEMIGTYPSGNICLSTALLCSGGIPSKTIRLLKFWGVQCFTKQTFFVHQRKFINQAVSNCWEEEYIDIFSRMGDEVQLSGDARCDSMGHCAKYASYSLHDTKQNAIACTELLVSTEPQTQKSAAMEKLGLIRALHLVDQCVPHIKVQLTTDGHPGVAKYLREEKSETVTHYLDIWHVAKGLKKRMAKLKRIPEIKKWQRSIINHLYWCAVTSDYNGKLMVAKWRSLANHIINIHVHEDALFPTCAHGELTPRLWLDPASEAYDVICQRIILNKEDLKYVEKLSSDGQTSGLEGFHSTINHFAPKMYHFGYQGMKTRVQLAALHFIENGRQKERQKKTQDGNLCYNIKFPKSRGGQYVVVPVMKEPTYGYAAKVTAETIKLVRSGITHEIIEVEPASLCANYERPSSKEQAVSEHYARFQKH